MSRLSPKRKCYGPAHGFEKNPMYWDYGRNELCPCDSGKKFKRCCRPGVPRYIPADVVNDYKESMDAMRRQAYGVA